MTRFPSDFPDAAQRCGAAVRPRVSLIAARALLLAGALMAGAAQAAPAVGDRVALTACPHVGATAPCLTVNGADGTVYNITGASPKPPLNGRMIRLRATVSDKVSACLQGLGLDRIRWTPVRQKCTN
jgi:hypothetical protein